MVKEIIRLVIFAAALTQSLCTYDPISHEITYCEDCPYTSCCNENFECSTTSSACWYSTSQVSDPINYCYESSCDNGCCVNGVCGTYAQCYLSSCYDGDCESGCCNSNFCGSQSYCAQETTPFKLVVQIGVVVLALLLIIGLFLCCKFSTLLKKYKPLTSYAQPTAGNLNNYQNPQVHSNLQNASPVYPQNYQQLQNNNYNPSNQGAYTQMQ